MGITLRGDHPRNTMEVEPPDGWEPSQLRGSMGSSFPLNYGPLELHMFSYVGMLRGFVPPRRDHPRSFMLTSVLLIKLMGVLLLIVSYSIKYVYYKSTLQYIN